MSRQLDQLASVFGDLESRYGSDDEIVLEVKSTFEELQVVESKRLKRLVPANIGKLFKTLARAKDGEVGRS
jgi:hypothetical protein